MKPITEDEKQVVLRRLASDLGRLRTDAGNLGQDFLAFLIAQAQDGSTGAAGEAGK